MFELFKYNKIKFKQKLHSQQIYSTIIICFQKYQVKVSNILTQLKMGQQCSHTVEQVQQVMNHRACQPTSEQIKIQIDLMRNKNQGLINAARTYISQDGKQQFFGYIQDGSKQGYGQLKTSQQKRYYGYFKDNLPNIKGVLIFSNNHYYIGQFESGKMHGKGKQISPLFSFQGEFYHDNKKYGKLVTSDFKYQGSFEQQGNLFGGYGQLYFKNGQKYLGYFFKGDFHGQGMYYDQNDELIYEGSWQNSLYNGIGKYYWEDGSYFQGQYKKGLKQGQGKYYKQGQDVIHGVWEEGQITSRYKDNSLNSTQKFKNNKSSHSTKVEQIY